MRFRHLSAIFSAACVLLCGAHSAAQAQEGDTVYLPLMADAEPVDAIGLATAFRHTCALTHGDVHCWGWTGYGQLGVNPGWTPVSVVGFEGSAP